MYASHSHSLPDGKEMGEKSSVYRPMLIKLTGLKRNKLLMLSPCYQSGLLKRPW